MHSAYALRYLGTRRYIIFSLFHYLYCGETRGYKPNPFFDPASAGVCFATYLRDKRKWLTPISAIFDPVFYERRSQSSKCNPLVHFWRIGFAADYNPSQDFDARFFKDVVAFYRQDYKEFAFEIVTDDRRWLPGNEAIFRAKQQKFYSDITLTVVRRPKTPKRRHLVFIQADSGFVNPYVDPGRSFDILINNYGAEQSEFGSDVEYIVEQPGTKTTAIRKLLADQPDLLLLYDYVFFLDDDVVLSGNDIDRLFAIVSANQVDLAQPSLTPMSSCAFEGLKQPTAGRGLVSFTAVEIMMPVVSRRALVTCGWVFGEAISGWAVDFLLAMEVRRHFGETIALVGAVVAAHERGVDTQDGAFYRFLRSKGIEATTELGLIARQFGIDVSLKAIRPCNESLQ